ncbi:MAG: hypothetical protein AAGB05_01775 [Pseudomonadota bacterium]
MTYYDHASELAHRVGPWAGAAGTEKPAAAHQTEATLAQVRQAEAKPPATSSGARLIGVFLSYFGR